VAARPESYPVCEDPETRVILRDAEENWDPSSNNTLILESDRWLVSDYVFLTLRQCRCCFAGSGDSARLRRMGSAVPGLCCIHCMDRPQTVSPSGRTFPSAPDNFASALNSSLYAHMQACSYVPANLKRALANTRKIHSNQCSSLRFGSQRRFFTLLFDRLRRQRHVGCVEENDTAASSLVTAPGSGPVSSAPVESSQPESVPETKGSSSDFYKYGFLEAGNVITCAKCRMVPIQFRAGGSVFIARKPAAADMEDHSSKCKTDSFDLEIISRVLYDVERVDCRGNADILRSRTFRELVGACVADRFDLSAIFVDDAVELVSRKRSLDSTNGGKDRVSPSSGSLPGRPTKGLWSRFPAELDRVKIIDAFKALALEYSDTLSPRMRDNPALVKFLLLIAPALDLSSVDVDDNNDDDEQR